MADARRPLDEYDLVPTLAHLSSLVGHHLINSFSAIVSNAEILRLADQSGHPIDRSCVIDTIIRTSMEASTVARNMIDLARPMTRASMEQVELTKLIAEAVDQQRPTASAEVEFVRELQPLPSIPGRAKDLLGMFRSVLANSIEAIGERPGTIRIRSYLDERGWIHIEFSDDGEGMTADTLENALEPFQSTKPGRLGIGLCIANSVWRRHRGSLSVRSRAGEGTTLHFSLNPATVEPRPI